MTKKLAFETVGSGPDLVLLHGWGLNSGVWQILTEHLSLYFTLRLIDLPGYGINRDIVPEHYDLKSIASLVSEVVPNNAALLGWSLGGLVAQQIALSKSVQLSKLIIVASSPCFVEHVREWPGIKQKVLNDFAELLAKDIGKTVERFLAIQAYGSPSLRQDLKRLQQSILGNNLPAEKALQKGLDILSEVDLRNELCHTDSDTLRIYGKLDSLVPKSSIDAIQACHPASTSKVFEKSSHAPFISEAEAFSAFLLKNI